MQRVIGSRGLLRAPCFQRGAVRSYSTPNNTYIDVSKLTVQKTTHPKPKTPHQKLVFGKEFTDHMLTVDWSVENGWEAPKITPYGNLSISPASCSLHYAIQLFEGMKAYKDKEGRVRLFRPDKNFERMNNSARRLALPTLNPEGVTECIKALLRVDQDWIPSEKGYSLYLRPTLIGNQESLGVSPPNAAKMFVICSPVGPYYPDGFKPVKLLADHINVRAWPGGTGSYKLGANYAGGILPQQNAMKRGYSQILWLFSDQHYLTEVGTMNLFLFWKNEEGKLELVTPPLDGSILPGVTRDSILTIVKEWNEFQVTERPVKMAEVIKAIEEKRLMEIFGAGTAAIVSPVKQIHFNDKDYDIPINVEDPSATIGPLARRVVDRIMAIQYGEVDHPWSVIIDDQ
ncbi:branched-chain amino acid aminotransferase [Planoprotostelium fungivorum]|uniref:Branched-chain-amino-acid aminotransferase n=1 Tax=Planoprotostelium fungivorum TaxID=1890364 RepID=A0A2P6N4H9_9EUKA|nr:branched-chain amino acid aminotransferase [Planoprotostelium fungivorum]